jgi:hypothetical protein
MTTLLINKYFNKIINKKLINNYKCFLNIYDFIHFNYFYWLYQDQYDFFIEGYCVKVILGKNNMSSFMLFSNIKNIKINQIFFFNNPFIFFFKKKNISLKRRKKIFVF